MLNCMKRLKTICILTIIIAAGCLLTSCSSMILSVGGVEEQEIINIESQRDNIIKIFGDPISSIDLKPPRTVQEIYKEYFQIYDGYRLPEVFDYSKSHFRDQLAVIREVYKYEGRIQRKSETGEALGMAGHTIFLSEILMVPHALKKQSDRSNEIHTITIWYDDSNTVLTYFWETELKSSMKE